MREQVRVKTGKFIAGLIIAILVSCAVLAMVCPYVHAASMWSKTYGGTGSDTGTGDTVQTSDGGYAISGDTNSSGTGGSDFWLIKTDSDGNAQWNETYGGAFDEVSGGMCLTSDGGFAIAGGTYSFGAGGEDFYLVKTDSAGNMQWNQTYGGTGLENGYALLQSSDGGYLLTGTTQSFGAGGNDIWLVKTDALGNAPPGVPEGLTLEAMLILSSVAVVVSIRYFRKHPKIKNSNQVKL